MITLDMMRRLWPRGDSKIPGLVEAIAAAAPAIFAKYGFISNTEIAQAMAQFSHECGAGTEMVENIHYTAERAAQVWPTRFRDAADCYAKVGSFRGDPDFPGKLIDSVYGTRMGNRPGTHDGRTFIGRGLSQVTGRNGYTALGNMLGVDLTADPEWVIRPEHALEAGVADFVLCGCLPYAKVDDTLMVTKKLNGGTVGLEDRKAWLVKWKQALAASPSIVPEPARAPPKPTPKVEKKHVATGSVVVAGGAAAQQAHEAGLSPIVIVLIIVATVAAAFIAWRIFKKPNQEIAR